MTRMRLLIVTDCFPNKSNLYSGIFIQHRCTELTKHSAKIHVFKYHQLLNQNFEFSYMKDYTLDSLGFSSDIDVTIVPTFLQTPTIFQSQLVPNLTLGNKIKRNQFDIIHFHFLWSVAAINKILSLKIPYVVTCHGSDVNNLSRHSQRTIDYRIGALNRADHVFFVSQKGLDNAVQMGFSGKNYSVIPNGYNSDSFYRNEDKSDGPVVGFVGNLYPIKRAEKLPEIFNQILSQHPSTKCYVIGDGELKEQIQSKCNSFGISDSVFFIDKIPQNELGVYMREMDVLMLPSRNEGFPCVVKEAQACGTAVVGSDRGGIPEAIGAGGKIVKEGPDFDIRFADAVSSLLNKNIDSKILDAAVDGYTWEQTVKKELAIYEQILD